MDVTARDEATTIRNIDAGLLTRQDTRNLRRHKLHGEGAQRD